MGTRNPQATVLLYAHPHTLLPGNTTLCAVDELMLYRGLQRHSPHIDVAQVNPRCISVSRCHVLAETAHFEQFCCYTSCKLINTLVCPRYIWQI